MNEVIHLISKKALLHVKVADLEVFPENARLHPPSQVRGIEASIKRFGFNNPVLIDENKQIIAGHGRVMAAKNLNMEVVPCIQILHLTQKQRDAYRLADNKLALSSIWSADTLAAEVERLLKDDGQEDLITALELGFEDSELLDLLGPRTAKDGITAGAHKNRGALADTKMTIGEYSFPIARNDYLRWQEEIRQTAGFSAPEIVDEIKRRMKL